MTVVNFHIFRHVSLGDSKLKMQFPVPERKPTVDSMQVKISTQSQITDFYMANGWLNFNAPVTRVESQHSISIPRGEDRTSRQRTWGTTIQLQG